MGSMFKKWVWVMAFREMRRGLKPLLLSMLCVILAVMSVVAAYSFRDNVQSTIRMQSKSLLGADLALESRQPFTTEEESLFRSLAGDQSRQIGFSSMAYFPASGKSRLVQVRAVSGEFPYYGALETEPPSAVETFRQGADALIDENLLLQMDARIGDRVKIGDHEFRIAGKLRKIPGEPVTFSLISPRVYVPMSFFEGSPLLQRGSIVRYRVYFKFDSRQDVDALVQRLAPRLQRLGLRADTVNRRMERISRPMENLSRYLRLAVFIAVLLAGVGVASGVHVYTKQKISSAAVLRCFGACPAETVVVNILQVVIVTLAGSLIGAALGVALQSLVPLAFRDFLPVIGTPSTTFSGVWVGLAMGLGTALLFSLVPLVPLRKISPLLALRASYEPFRSLRDPWLWLIFLLIAGTIFGLAVVTTANWLHGLYFSAGVLAVFALLVGIAKCLSKLMRHLAPSIFSFTWRQGLANLYRPSNQTSAVMLAIGLGTFLMVTLYSVQSMLLNEVKKRAGEGEPNLVIFDVQPSQRESVGQLFQSFSIPIRDEVPIVTMRLAAIKNRPVRQIRNDAKAKTSDWALRREYRSTYRSRLGQAERIIDGTWRGSVDPETKPIPVSLEKGIAETLRVAIGDPLQFDVQGVSLPTRVASIREVEWERLEPNFFVVFPEGVLEDAPQFYAVVARVETAPALARLQRAVVERFPNVSMIDLTLILNTLESILSRISAAIRFVALFTILTGLAVLASAVLSSRSQRIRESILLRTLGAPRRQIVTSIVAEYLFLAVISCLTGTALGIVASGGLSFYFFQTAATLSLVPILIIVVAVTVGTVFAGVLGCWGIFHRSPLEALRAEG
ncbi:MAG TPA: FtsX-like permease family protein [Candidatus Binatia bacterium]|nr:FtsX-like permease family protein [Candidatus Binatia bacterium]